jgi:hypothetical protein
MTSNMCAFKITGFSDIPPRWLRSETNGTDITSWESPSQIIQHQTIESVNNEMGKKAVLAQHMVLPQHLQWGPDQKHEEPTQNTLMQNMNTKPSSITFSDIPDYIYTYSTTFLVRQC